MGLGQRRYGAKQRLPLGDGETTVGEARSPADDDHAEDEGGDAQKPRPHIAKRGRLPGIEGFGVHDASQYGHEARRFK
jgi:hypothetical protein